VLILFLERKRIKKNFRFAAKVLRRQGCAPGNESGLFLENFLCVSKQGGTRGAGFRPACA